MKWLKRLFGSKPSPPQTYDVGGIEPDLDQYALDERADCIDRIVESGKSREEATALADSWYIMEVQASYGGRPATTKYVPRPVWDWDWGWRAMFDTREEAVAHIERKSGRILEA